MFLDHPSIVKLIEVYENQEYVFMVQEYTLLTQILRVFLG